MRTGCPSIPHPTGANDNEYHLMPGRMGRLVI
uniref:Uncharacterized protein n=1 Tax=Siphoviridae sp. ct4sp3 TaxID=2825332 RepID=A0A8S5PUB1_9CAUD|nr:MAG TPA: hypothetical protein [Siphoviridae sp. ct4sp3]